MRQAVKQVAFGYGIHLCIGASLARLEAVAFGKFSSVTILCRCQYEPAMGFEYFRGHEELLVKVSTAEQVNDVKPVTGRGYGLTCDGASRPLVNTWNKIPGSSYRIDRDKDGEEVLLVDNEVLLKGRLAALGGADTMPLVPLPYEPHTWMVVLKLLMTRMPASDC